jgi:hypothetical protein
MESCSLPLDIYRYLFTVAKFRLLDIIKLSTVSKNLRLIAFSEENWYIISDMSGALINFINRIFRSDISYPINKIRQMHIIECQDASHFNLHYPNLLSFTFSPKQEVLINFYEHFTNYQFLYIYNNMDTSLIYKKINVPLCGIYICGLGIEKEIFSRYPLLKEIPKKNNITEIFAPHSVIDCKLLVKYFPQIEKLEGHTIWYPEQLKQTKLKYLRIDNQDPQRAINNIIPHLPNTIESCVSTNIGFIAPAIMILYTKNHIQSFEMRAHYNRRIHIT